MTKIFNRYHPCFPSFEREIFNLYSKRSNIAFGAFDIDYSYVCFARARPLDP